jgi:hypothetical protein
MYRTSLPLSNDVRKFAALAAVLIVPALAFAGHGNGKGNDGQNNGKGNNRSDGIIPVCPQGERRMSIDRRCSAAFFCGGSFAALRRRQRCESPGSRCQTVSAMRLRVDNLPLLASPTGALRHGQSVPGGLLAVQHSQCLNI